MSHATVLYDYTPEDSATGVSVHVNDVVRILSVENSEWWLVELEETGEKCYIPSSYLKKHLSNDKLYGAGDEDMLHRASNMSDANDTWSRFGSFNETQFQNEDSFLGGRMTSQTIQGRDRESGALPLLAETGLRQTQRGARHVTGYTFVVSSLLRWTAFFALVVGVMQLMVSSFVNDDPISELNMLTQQGLYCVVVTAVILGYEVIRTTQMTTRGLGIRAIVYAGTSIWMLMYGNTFLVGLCLLFVGIFAFLAAYNGEDGLSTAYQRTSYSVISLYTGCCRVRNTSETACIVRIVRMLLLLGYIALNIAVYITAFQKRKEECKHSYERDIIHNDCDNSLHYLPYTAGALGTLISLNICVFLLMILPTIHRFMVNKANEAHNTVWKPFCAWIVMIYPPKHAIYYHKALFMVLLSLSIGHGFCYLLTRHAIHKHDQEVYGESDFDVYIGGGLLFLLVVILVGSQRAVRKYYYDLFHFSHGLFLLFTGLFIVHVEEDGRFSFYLWPCVVLQGIDFTMRFLMRRRRVEVLSLGFLPGGVAIRINKRAFNQATQFKYKAGQYCLMSVPGVSSTRWKPVLIASAPIHEDMMLYMPTVSMKLSKKENEHDERLARAENFWRKMEWSTKVRQFLQNISPVSNEFDVQQGYEISHPDGNFQIPIVRLDGPYAGAFQHMSRNINVIAVATNQDCYSLLSAVQDVVLDKWLKERNNRAKPRNFHAYWIISWEEVDNYAWLLSELAALQELLARVQKTHPDVLQDKSYEFGIFVIDCPRHIRQAAEGQREEEVGDAKYALYSAPSYWGPALDQTQRVADTLLNALDSSDSQSTVRPSLQLSSTRLDLYRACKYPQNTSVTINNCLRIWIGRPKWDQFFHSFQLSHPLHAIRVLFQGQTRFGDELDECCEMRNSARQEITFLRDKNF